MPVDCRTMPIRGFKALRSRPGSSRARDLARVAMAVALEDLDGGRLAGTVGPEQGEDLTAGDLEVHPVDRVQRAVGLAQASHEHRRVGSRGRGGRSGCRTSSWVSSTTSLRVPHRHPHRAIGRTTSSSPSTMSSANVSSLRQRGLPIYRYGGADSGRASVGGSGRDRDARDDGAADGVGARHQVEGPTLELGRPLAVVDARDDGLAIVDVKGVGSEEARRVSVVDLGQCGDEDAWVGSGPVAFNASTNRPIETYPLYST